MRLEHVLNPLWAENRLSLMLLACYDSKKLERSNYHIRVTTRNPIYGLLYIKLLTIQMINDIDPVIINQWSMQNINPMNTETENQY